MMTHHQFDGNIEPDISHKIIFNWKKILFSAIFAIVLMAWFFGFTNKLIDYYHLSVEDAGLQKKEKGLLDDIESLESEKKNLQQDWYIEKMAREKLNLAKPGEVLIKIVPSENP